MNISLFSSSLAFLITVFVSWCNDVMTRPRGDPDPVNTLPSPVSGDQAMAPAPIPGYWLLIVTPRPRYYLSRWTVFWSMNVVYIVLNWIQCPISQSLVKLMKSYESFVKGWICWLRKWSEGDLPTFERIWWDFWKIDLLDALAAAQTNLGHLAQRRGNGTGKLYLLNHFRSFYRFGHVSPYYNHIKTLAASDVNTWI